MDRKCGVKHQGAFDIRNRASAIDPRRSEENQCRQPANLRDKDRAWFGQNGIEPPAQLFEPVGCPACRGKGFRGRVGIFEVVLADAELVQLITQGATEHEVREQIRRAGTPDLTVDALAKVAAGLTSLDEARKMTWV